MKLFHQITEEMELTHLNPFYPFFVLVVAFMYFMWCDKLFAYILFVSFKSEISFKRLKGAKLERVQKGKLMTGLWNVFAVIFSL